MQLHNGAHIGLPPHATMEQAILHRHMNLLHKAIKLPGHKRYAKDMIITPVGVYVTFEPKGIEPGFEMLIPWANIYETHLFPADWVAPEPVKEAAPKEEPKVQVKSLLQTKKSVA